MFPPQSFPVALELRRVGVGHRPRITDGADATELQGLEIDPSAVTLND